MCDVVSRQSGELGPCPSCGSDNVHVQALVYFVEDKVRSYVECYDCGCSKGIVANPNGTYDAFYESDEDAIAAWNQRPDEESQAKILKGATK